MFIFVLSGALPRLIGLIKINHYTINKEGDEVLSYLNPFSWINFQMGKFILPSEPRFASLLGALWFIGMMWFFAYMLDKKKIYIKV